METMGKKQLPLLVFQRAWMAFNS